MFAEGLADLDNYGATHPAVQAHAVLGRTMLTALATAPTTTAMSRVRQTLSPFRPVNGG
jgi:beta-lactamase class A